MGEIFVVCQQHLRNSVQATYPDARFFTEDYVKQMFLSILKESWRVRPDALLQYVYDLERLPNRDYWKCVLGFSGARHAFLQDTKGRRERATLFGALTVSLPRIGLENALARALILTHLRKLQGVALPAGVDRRALSGDSNVLYLRTDFAFGLQAGGSVAHINGVIGGFIDHGYPVTLFTNDAIPITTSEQPEEIILDIPQFFRNVPEIWALRFNDVVIEKCSELLSRKNFALIYQRYSLNNYAGLYLARTHGLPFVAEYNGSEVWVGKHWGRGLKYPSLAERIELANLANADLVVVVSNAMRNELLERGVAEEKILVNPNGYDDNAFKPEVDGSAIRKKLSITRPIVVGFIGTFGPWHGAEVLAQAAVTILSRRSDIHFVFIGEGSRKPQAERIIADGNAEDAVTFTGLIPQSEAPLYLAACDILVAPHVENPDGTEFFGSPTKLFEYMGMGKAIVASRVGQIGAVIRDGVNGLVAKPGDAVDLARAIETLANDENLRKKLGQEAYREAKERYTWKAHSKRIIDRLRDDGFLR